MAATLTRAEAMAKEIIIKHITDENRNEVNSLTSGNDHMANPSAALSVISDKDSAETRAIYLGEILIGFAMWGHQNENNNDVNLYAFMLDKQYQGLGLGKRSLECILDEIVGSGECKIFLTVSEHNNVAKKVYENIGFDRLEAEGSTVMYGISWKK